MKDLQKETGLNKTNLEWHLSILEQGFCVEKIEESGKLLYKLTKEGQLIEYLI
jgi:DNA-binding transcriptional ArsR family regulator